MHRELAEQLAAAKDKIGGVLDVWPSEAAFGVSELERAIELVGQCETEMDRIADEHGERA